MTIKRIISIIFILIFSINNQINAQSIIKLSTSQINSFIPYLYFSSAAYCLSNTILQWSCGTNCNANKDFIYVASGGDGNVVKFWYVGFDPKLSSVILAIQGTDVSNMETILSDRNNFLVNLDNSLFPGISSSIEVNSEISNEWNKIATDCFSSIRTALSTYNSNTITITGHSLGGALGSLASIYLPLHISNINIKLITFGMSRIGNQAFADYVDANINATHINNKKDPIPILPGNFIGYHHFSGEIHIEENDNWVSCPGQDNSNTQCIVGDVPNIFDGNISDNYGPYNGITISC